MSELSHLLTTVVAQKSQADRVAVLLSAGRDSITTAIACQLAGKIVHAYTYELAGYRSSERERVEAIASHFRWQLTVVTVPTDRIVDDFKRLAVAHHCKRKVHFEVLFPMLYVIPQITENEVWTGWNADDHYGNAREYIFHQARLVKQGLDLAERKKDFDEYRKKVYVEFDRSGSSHTFWLAEKVASDHGKRLLDAYADRGVREWFSCYDHHQLSPSNKPVIREQFRDWFAGFPDQWVAKGERLQKGGKVHELFGTLLPNAEINRFETKYHSVSPLCIRWAKEVAANRQALESQPLNLRESPASSVRVSSTKYRPYSMAEVAKASAAARFNVISAFAGGGGSSVGYRLAGGRILLANEFVPEARRTYRHNFPDVEIDERDIREFSGSNAEACALLTWVGMEPGDLDVLDGSPPCCEFSTAGSGIGDQEVLRAYSDVKQNNIASLPFDLVDLAIAARPKVFICENVPAFASRGREVFDRVLKALRFTGGRAYYADWKVLTASDFGVPQKRQRLFIIGVREDVGNAVGIESDAAVASVFPVATRVGVDVRSAFADLRQSDDDVWPWMRAAAITRLRELIRLLPKEPPKPTRLGHLFPGYRQHFTLTRCSWDRPAPTMVVTGQRPDGLTGAIHPEHDRKFTIPELKRLTGLPDDFVLTGTIGQAAERICRMVPPLMTKAIADSVYEKILKPHMEKTRDRL